MEGEETSGEPVERCALSAIFPKMPSRLYGCEGELVDTDHNW
jgi:hypothetical protein